MATGTTRTTAPVGATSTLSSEQLIERQLTVARRHVKAIELGVRLLVGAVGVIVYLLLVVLVDHWLFDLGAVGRWLALIVLSGGAAWYFARHVVAIALRSVNPLYVARVIEQVTPSLQNSLINYLFLKPQRGTIHESIYRAIQQRAARDVGELEVEATVDHSPVFRLAYVFLAMIALLGAYKVFSPKDPFPTMRRVLAPWASISRPARVQILDLSPGDAQAFQGDSLPVSARVVGLGSDEQVTLVYSTDDGQTVERSLPLVVDTDGRTWRVKLPPEPSGLQQNVTYRLVAGDAHSPTYRVTVVPAPLINVERVEYEYPTYMARPRRVVERQGDLSAWEGTRVTLHAVANQPIQSAWVEFEPSTAEGSDAAVASLVARTSPAPADRVQHMKVEGKSAQISFLLEMTPDRRHAKNGAYVVRYLTTDQQRNARPSVHRIEVLPDVAPEVEIVKPAEERVAVPADGVLTVDLRALDPDFALTRLAVEGRLGGSTAFERTLMEEPRGAVGPVLRSWKLAPAELGLKSGDKLTLTAIADDNRAAAPSFTPAPNQRRSRELWIEVTAAVRGNDEGSEEAAKDDESPGDSKNPMADEVDSSKPGEQKPEDGKPESEKPDGSKPPMATPDKDTGKRPDKARDKSSDSKDPAKSGSTRDKTSDKPSDKPNSKPNEKSSEKPSDKPGEKPGDKPSDKPNSKPGEKPSEKPNQKPGEKPGEQSRQPNSSQQGKEKQPGQKPENKPDGKPMSKQPMGGSSDNSQGAKPNDKPMGGGGGAGKDAGDEPPPDMNSGSNDGAQNDQKKPGEGTSSGGSRGSRPNDGRAKPSDISKESVDNADAAPPGESGSEGSPSQPLDDGEVFERALEHLRKQQAKQDSRPGQSESSPRTDGGSSDSATKPENIPGPAAEKRSDDATGKPEGKPTGEQPDRNAQGAGKPNDAATSGTQSGQPMGPAETKADESPKETQTPTSKSPGSQASNGESGAGQASKQDRQAPAAMKENVDLEKFKKPDDSKPADSPDPSAPSQSKRQRDSKGGVQGDQSGGGQRGGGQGAKQAGNDSAGNSTSADEGAGASPEAGAGDTSGRAGSQQESPKPTGKPGEKLGPGSGLAPGVKGNDAAPNQPEGKPGGDGKPSDSPQKKLPNAPATGTGGGASATGGGGIASDTSKLRGTPGGPVAAGDEGNAEFARRATDLVLEHLKNQADQPDEELLRQLGWTADDLRQFVAKWQSLKQAANENDPNAQRELNESLRSLGLRPTTDRRRAGGATADVQRDNRDAGARSNPPSRYQDRFNAFRRGTSQ